MTTSEPKRRSIRLQDFDYRQPGFYFITICVKNREMAFGKIENGEMNLNHNGQMAHQIWDKLPQRFPCIELDQYIIMPNHVHGIIMLKDEQPILYRKATTAPVPERFKEHMKNSVIPYKRMPDLAQIVRSFKGEATYRIHTAGTPTFAWQGGYYESILHDKALAAIRLYIVNNPANWVKDKLYQDNSFLP